LAKNSDGDQGEREQEQSKHSEAERRACLAGDRRDRRGSCDEPHDGEVATQKRRESARAVARRGAGGCGCGWAIVRHHDAGGDDAGAGEHPREAGERAECAARDDADAGSEQRDGEAGGGHCPVLSAATSPVDFLGA